jgi:septal ring factor EnvC (AmiA/AmiB activator)
MVGVNRGDPMKRAVLPILCLLVLLSIPAVSQEEAMTLDKEVEALKKKVEEQDAALKALQTYVDRQKAQASKLIKDLAAAEAGGFLEPAPNNDAKKALLSGLQEFAGVAAGEEPKAEPREE